ncbi:hypothetical protein BDK51DRAFT_41777 [Blyttiomyces helicus]|uniref:Helicase ATP-binding domain-containing protein n=1 Tax=Blyttiomyces helicus TaxID=388810 RepID=A0A4P9WM09_9FUNG|nr:hypothetical protein BDK51DRAFT_41777 [Blyttiomyces helicus]|eukprot:RKO92688.1 hypothetical protein BDK51DRAFT_41777 [Blyttiomyces helicus]
MSGNNPLTWTKDDLRSWLVEYDNSLAEAAEALFVGCVNGQLFCTELTEEVLMTEKTFAFIPSQTRDKLLVGSGVAAKAIAEDLAEAAQYEPFRFNFLPRDTDADDDYDTDASGDAHNGPAMDASAQPADDALTEHVDGAAAEPASDIPEPASRAAPMERLMLPRARVLREEEFYFEGQGEAFADANYESNFFYVASKHSASKTPQAMALRTTIQKKIKRMLRQSNVHWKNEDGSFDCLVDLREEDDTAAPPEDVYAMWRPPGPPGVNDVKTTWRFFSEPKPGVIEIPRHLADRVVTTKNFLLAERPHLPYVSSRFSFIGRRASKRLAEVEQDRKRPKLVRRGIGYTVLDGGYKCRRLIPDREAASDEREASDGDIGPYGTSDIDDYETDSELEADLEDERKREERKRQRAAARAGRLASKGDNPEMNAADRSPSLPSSDDEDDLEKLLPPVSARSRRLTNRAPTSSSRGVPDKVASKIVAEAIEAFEAKWREAALPILEASAYTKWNGNRGRFEILETELDRIKSNRLPAQIIEVKSSGSESTIKRMCSSLQETVFRICELEWIIDLIGKPEPARPPPVPRPPRGNKAAGSSRTGAGVDDDNDDDWIIEDEDDRVIYEEYIVGEEDEAADTSEGPAREDREATVEFPSAAVESIGREDEPMLDIEFAAPEEELMKIDDGERIDHGDVGEAEARESARANPTPETAHLTPIPFMCDGSTSDEDGAEELQHFSRFPIADADRFESQETSTEVELPRAADPSSLTRVTAAAPRGPSTTVPTSLSLAPAPRRVATLETPASDAPQAAVEPIVIEDIDDAVVVEDIEVVEDVEIVEEAEVVEDLQVYYPKPEAWDYFVKEIAINGAYEDAFQKMLHICSGDDDTFDMRSLVDTQFHAWSPATFATWCAAVNKKMIANSSTRPLPSFPATSSAGKTSNKRRRRRRRRPSDSEDRDVGYDGGHDSHSDDDGDGDGDGSKASSGEASKARVEAEFAEVRERARKTKTKGRRDILPMVQFNAGTLRLQEEAEKQTRELLERAEKDKRRAPKEEILRGSGERGPPRRREGCLHPFVDRPQTGETPSKAPCYARANIVDKGNNGPGFRALQANTHAFLVSFYRFASPAFIGYRHPFYVAQYHRPQAQRGRATRRVHPIAFDGSRLVSLPQLCTWIEKSSHGYSQPLRKTLQTIVFLYILRREINADNPGGGADRVSGKGITDMNALNFLQTGFFLVVTPSGPVVDNWAAEIRKWIPAKESGMVGTLINLQCCPPSQRLAALTECKEKKGILLVGYELFRPLVNPTGMAAAAAAAKDAGVSQLVDDDDGSDDEVGPSTMPGITQTDAAAISAILTDGPAVAIFDEGHKIKNPDAKLTIAAQMIKTPSRILLSGYPLQNNLMEYYTMVDFVRRNLLGEVSEFKRNYHNPIENGTYADSTPSDEALSLQQLQLLTTTTEPVVNRTSRNVPTS